MNHHRSALAAATALAMTVVVAGAARADKFQLTASSSSVAGTANAALVDIVSTDGYQEATSAGTGMILSGGGEILTNNHVINGATSIKVTVISSGRTYRATVVGTDPTQDVAVIQLVGASGLKTVPIAAGSSLSVGQGVVASGNAGGVGGAASVVTGKVTALNQSITATDQGSSDSEQLVGLIESNAPIVAGDSGGALATTSGKVIGMNTAASASLDQSGGGYGGGWPSDQSGEQTGSQAGTESQAYAIPIKTALTIAGQIEAGKASSTIHIGLHGFLGIELQQAPSFAGGYYQYGGYQGGSQGDASASGAVVGGVIAQGAAASAGLVAGDVITSVNGRTIASATTLNTILSATRAGQRITLGWADAGGQNHTQAVALGTAAAD